MFASRDGLVVNAGLTPFEDCVPKLPDLSTGQPNALDSTWLICEKSNGDESGAQRFIDPRAAGGDRRTLGCVVIRGVDPDARRNLRSSSFADAVSRTFDGQHPCSLCKVIASAKRSEKRMEFPQPLTKLEFPLTTQLLLLVAPTRFQLVSIGSEFVESLSQQPPTPPPRASCA